MWIWNVDVTLKLLFRLTKHFDIAILVEFVIKKQNFKFNTDFHHFGVKMYFSTVDVEIYFDLTSDLLTTAFLATTTSISLSPWT